jgi:hypothetical protein
MALVHTPLATGEIHREFEADVLADLVRHKAAMHGCPVWKVESKLDGGIAVWFRGPRPGLANWEGALRFNFPFVQDKKLLGDVNAVVETTLQLLADVAAKDTQPLIQRAQG